MKKIINSFLLAIVSTIAFSNERLTNDKVFDSLRKISKEYRYHGQFDSVLLMEYKINEVAKKKGNLYEEIFSYIILSNIYINIQELDKANKNLKIAENMLSKNSDYFLLTRLYTEFSKM